MYILLSSALHALEDPALTVREAFSGMLGTISIVCWIFFLMPQLIENYRNQSAEALSFAFLGIWLFGDLANFFGGLWSDLIPTAVALAAWFVFLDVALISQALYYGIRNRRREGDAWLAALRQSVSGDALRGDAAEAVERVRRQQQQEEEEESDEEQPLLKRTMSAQRFDLAAPNGTSTSATRPALTPAERRNSLNQEWQRNRRASNLSNSFLSKIVEENDHHTAHPRVWLKNSAILILVYAIGALCWFIAYKTGTWQPVPLEDNTTAPDADSTPKGAQILGYASAVLYLGARIPQMVKNWREQSCEGLALLLFMMSMSGNLTQGLSLLAHSTRRDDVLKSLPWIIGSLGTIAEDGIIFFQFWLYGTRSDPEEGDDEVAVE